MAHSGTAQSGAGRPGGRTAGLWLVAATAMAMALSGCAPHSLPLYAGQARTVTVEDSVFLVRWTDRRAEATRMSQHLAPDRMIMLSRALRAIEGASGCRVQAGSLYGDTSLAEAFLDCPETRPERLQPRLTHRPPIGDG